MIRIKDLRIGDVVKWYNSEYVIFKIDKRKIYANKTNCNSYQSWGINCSAWVELVSFRMFPGEDRPVRIQTGGKKWKSPLYQDWPDDPPEGHCAEGMDNPKNLPQVVT